MNNLSSATLTVIIQTLSEKVEAQTLIMGDLEDHIRRDHLTMDDMQFTITDLRRQVGDFTDMSEENYRLRQEVFDLRDKAERYDSLRTRNEELSAQVRQLTSETYKLKFGGKTPEETAEAYMANQGASLWAGGERIAVYKVVKAVTEWDLRATKDFCEAYIARQAEAKSDEVSGTGTKRSSQIPAGVGTSVRKSA